MSASCRAPGFRFRRQFCPLPRYPARAAVAYAMARPPGYWAATEPWRSREPSRPTMALGNCRAPGFRRQLCPLSKYLGARTLAPYNAPPYSACRCTIALIEVVRKRVGFLSRRNVNSSLPPQNRYRGLNVVAKANPHPAIRTRPVGRSEREQRSSASC